MGFQATSTTFSVLVAGDDVYEHTESFTVNLTTPDNVTIADDAAIGSIINDEAVPTLTVSAAARIEGDPPATPTVTAAFALSGKSAFTTSATWATADGTAAAPGDYQPVTATVSFAPGVPTRSASLGVVGDVITETDEVFSIGLSAPAPAGDVVLGATASVTIRDDDAAVSVLPSSTTEPSLGTTPLPVTLTLSHANPRTVQLNWSTANGTATAPEDYVAVGSSPVTFPAGTTSKSVNVTVQGDTSGPDEGDETFTVGLAGITGGQPGTVSAPMTIHENPCTVIGTQGNDVPLVGTPGHDVICGLGGNDVIRPGDVDAIDQPGEDHDDTIYGGDASGPSGTDRVDYSTAVCNVLVDLDTYSAEDSSDATGAVSDCIGNDLIFSIGSATGTQYDDRLRGSEGANVLQGFDGNDILLGDAGNDILSGGIGVDMVSYVRGSSTAVTVNLSKTIAQNTVGAGLDTITTVEGVFGTSCEAPTPTTDGTCNDTITGNSAANTLSGLDGNDLIAGGAGGDILYGLAGNDTLKGEGGVDEIYGGDGADSISGGDAVDLLLDGGDGDDVIYGGAGVEHPTNFDGGPGVDYCGQGDNPGGGAVAGPGCENNVARSLTSNVGGFTISAVEPLDRRATLRKENEPR